jgi:hypothetical protein
VLKLDSNDTSVNAHRVLIADRPGGANCFTAAGFAASVTAFLTI